MSTQQFTLHRLTRAASQLISGIHTLLTSIEAQIGRQFHANATPQSHRNAWHRPEKAVELHRLRPGQWLFWIFGGLEGLDRLVETAVAKNLAKRTWAFRLHTQQLPSRNPKSQCQTENILSYQSVEQKKRQRHVTDPTVELIRQLPCFVFQNKDLTGQRSCACLAP